MTKFMIRICNECCDSKHIEGKQQTTEHHCALCGIKREVRVVDCEIIIKKERCKAKIYDGRRCAQSAVLDGYCIIHYDQRQRRQEKFGTKKD